ncbi:uncharacterized protein [Watersipora subatra]|uniref:uncharacterized protein n=1 Tax=Watersipora subatra TaxID=2589382 RepID=UPI00355C1E1B
MDKEQKREKLTTAQTENGCKPKRVVEKRNTRERTRIGVINTTYQTLRQFFPRKKCGRRMSKLEILQRTINYIKDLKSALNDELPTSPSKLANTALPKKPRNRRARPTEIFPRLSEKNLPSAAQIPNRLPLSMTENTPPTTSGISNQGNFEQMPYWQNELHMSQGDNSENTRSCQYALPMNEANTCLYYNQHNPLPHSSPVNSQCSSAYGTSPITDSPENSQWRIDFSKSPVEDEGAFYPHNNSYQYSSHDWFVESSY